MIVAVRLAGHLNRDGKSRDVTAELGAGATLADLVAALGIPRGEVGAVYLDGKGALLDAVLSDGSRVEVFPPIVGG